MDESVVVFSNQAEMPTSYPVERNDTQDGVASERANIKPEAAKKVATAQKVRGRKSVKETTKSVKNVSNSSTTKRTIDKTTKPSVSGAKRAAKTKASSDKSPIKKKASTSKEKIPKKSTKEDDVKKPSAKPSAKPSKNSNDSMACYQFLKIPKIARKTPLLHHN
ncbi:hypothetical protein AVEN_60670-1 [Araneus ventricosus]|uniref:Uncharacterized protein n=1 Tax=Araneus ventricosus TaxID=182803 RepID=A0A4Y2H2D1_ARAVE|nr:hypothetical protein AVEN_60670-1 [Araneus ventricosus]